jgi:predicted signal transduction protein with EAL and GGDEF domain
MIPFTLDLLVAAIAFCVFCYFYVRGAAAVALAVVREGLA